MVIFIDIHIFRFFGNFDIFRFLKILIFSDFWHFWKFWNLKYVTEKKKKKTLYLNRKNIFRWDINLNFFRDLLHVQNIIFQNFNFLTFSYIMIKFMHILRNQNMCTFYVIKRRSTIFLIYNCKIDICASARKKYFLQALYTRFDNKLAHEFLVFWVKLHKQEATK